MAEIGEFVVGAYLTLEKNCDIVCYNVRPLNWKKNAEIDVIAVRFNDKTVYLCEATTHMQGMQKATAEKTVNDGASCKIP